MASHTRLPFGGHEKFTFRYGWLKKGLDAILEDPLIFARKDAFVRLGVGKNMASSIRYWGLAFGLFQPAANNMRALVPSRFGQALLADDGWDPYLEDIGSLWLLHWKLASNQEQGLVWHLAFSVYHDIEFHKARLVDFLKVELERRGIVTTESMIEREFEVFIHTYVPAQSRKVNSEETLGCPLVDLNLVRSLGDLIYRFEVGAKPSLPTSVFAYALLEFLEKRMVRQRTIRLDDCVYLPGSPGQIFKLDENSVLEYLENLEALTEGALSVQETAGLRQVYLRDVSPELGWELLRKYYG